MDLKYIKIHKILIMINKIMSTMTISKCKILLMAVCTTNSCLHH